jgi:ABC-type lipoprotein release transport system permease subunit
MLTWKLAGRNLLRHKRRSLITAAAIVFSFALLVIFMGMGEGAHRQMIDMGVRMGSGHVVVQAEGYQGDPTLDHVIRAPAPVLAALRDRNGGGEVAPRLFGSGLVRAGDKSVGAAIAGVDPGAEARTNDLAGAEKRVAGDWLRARAEHPFANDLSDLYLGQTLARTLDVEVGDRVALTVQPKDDDDPRSAAFQVRGVFRTGNDELDGFFVQIPLPEAQALLGVGDALSQVALVLPDQTRTAAVTAELRAALADAPVEVLPWQEALPELHEFIVLDDASFYLFMGIVFVLVAMGIFNTVMTSVIERTREFGLLTALGTRPRRVAGVVLTEAALIGLLGVALGLALGLAGNHYFAVHGLDYSLFTGGESMEAMGLDLAMVIYAWLPVDQLVRATAAVFAVVVLSALWPAVRAARLKSLEALHHV